MKALIGFDLRAAYLTGTNVPMHCSGPEFVRTLVPGWQLAAGSWKLTRDMERVQQFAPALLAEILRRQPPSDARTALAWQVAVGTAVARATTVRLDKGRLIVTATDPRWIAEIERAREPVLHRMQHLLGPDSIRTISLSR
jgi:hypothetical protein